MERSQYLAQALASMDGSPVQGAPGPDLMAMKKQADAAAAWKAANPGKSYLGHQAQEMGANAMAAPGRIAAALGRLP